ncbi:MAG TPA: hypothetical protein ENI46_02030 [Firmicutes bacterium]|nr:hypothetical protein [Bacillota bacterium]
MEVIVRATSHLAETIPASGRVVLEEGSRVGDLLESLGVNSDLIMLIVIDGSLGDLDTPLKDGSKVELIPPVSGG